MRRTTAVEGGTYYVPADPHNTGDAPQCSRCKRFLAIRKWLPPYAVTFDVSGAAATDVVFGPSPDLLVSERFAAAWAAEGLRGLAGFEPATVVAKSKRKRVATSVHSYLHVTVDHDEVSVAADSIHWRGASICPLCRQGDFLEGWDRIELEGTPSRNVFFPRGVPELVADESVREFFARHAFDGVIFTPAAESTYSYTSAKIFPGD